MKRKLGATSYHDTALGIVARSKLLKFELEGTKRGLEFIATSVANGITQITPDFILELHNKSFGWIFPNWGGKFRTIQVTYSGKEAPPHHQVRELVENLCLDLQARIKSKRNPVEVLAWFQHQFVYIHPFNDYNGRTARILTVLICYLVSLPPFEIKVEQSNSRKKYIDAMKAGDEGDLSKLEQIIKKSLDDGAMGKDKITPKK